MLCSFTHASGFVDFFFACLVLFCISATLRHSRVFLVQGAQNCTNKRQSVLYVLASEENIILIKVEHILIILPCFLNY